MLDPVFMHLADPKWLVRGQFLRNYYVAGWGAHASAGSTALLKFRWLNFPLRAVPLSACGQGTASAISSGRK